jgi:hypothetical protein
MPTPTYVVSGMNPLAVTVNGASIVHTYSGLTPGSGNAQVTAITASYTPTLTGKLVIVATTCGTDGTEDDTIEFQIYRNPTSTTGAPGGTALGSNVEGSASHSASGTWLGTISITDIVSVGTPVTYGISATSNNAHNLTGSTASITLLELP